MMAEVKKSTLNDLDAMFEKARTLSDFIEKHCSQKVKIIFGKDLTEEQFETVPDDVVIINGEFWRCDGFDCADSIEAVRNVGSPLHLNYFGDPIEGIVLGDGTVWFDPYDFQYRRDPKTHLLKDVEGARRKLEEIGGSDYVQTFDDGKILISFDGLQELTEADGWIAEDFCPWCESVIGVWIESFWQPEYAFSISYSNS
ncbi:MAG: hypothetical protein IJQ31_14855 [Thermoguttaceae bacterium]|nr:hypothetical protein [Thermoguttaceae bacterium]